MKQWHQTKQFFSFWDVYTEKWVVLHGPKIKCVELSLSLSHVTPYGQSASLSWYKAPIRGLRPDISSVRNTEYVWQLRSWFCGAPSLTRGRACLLYVPLALASTVFLGPSPLGLATTVFYCLRFETSLFVASYDSQGHGGGIRPRLHTGLCGTGFPFKGASYTYECECLFYSVSCQ
jgi:hypothetical protein